MIKNEQFRDDDYGTFEERSLEAPNLRCQKYRVKLKPGISNVNFISCLALQLFGSSLYVI